MRGSQRRGEPRGEGRLQPGCRAGEVVQPGRDDLRVGQCQRRDFALGDLAAVEDERDPLGHTSVVADVVDHQWPGERAVDPELLTHLAPRSRPR
nr:hypothetical protein [Amycolatopsis sp. GM8]